MKELVFTAEEVNAIQNIVQELPTKFGIPLVNIINGAVQRAQKALEPSASIPEPVK